jgi:hypothetical protein
MQPIIKFAPGCGYITSGEQAAASRLVRAIISRGLSIQVNDGGEDMLPQPSREEALIMAVLGSTAENVLQVWGNNGKTPGAFHLLWANNDDGSEIVWDHTSSPLFDEIYAEAFPD